MNDRTKRRLVLFRQHPFCHWCGIKVISPNSSKNPPPDNAATLDHLYSRLSTHRRNGYHGKTVLACYACNHRRGQEEDRQWRTQLAKWSGGEDEQGNRSPLQTK